MRNGRNRRVEGLSLACVHPPPPSGSRPMDYVDEFHSLTISTLVDRLEIALHFLQAFRSSPASFIHDESSANTACRPATSHQYHHNCKNTGGGRRSAGGVAQGGRTRARGGRCEHQGAGCVPGCSGRSRKATRNATMRYSRPSSLSDCMGGPFIHIMCVHNRWWLGCASRSRRRSTSPRPLPVRARVYGFEIIGGVSTRPWIACGRRPKGCL